MMPRLLAICLTVGLALPLGAAAPDPASTAWYALALDATLQAEARYFDGHGTTHFSFVMFQGDQGGTTRRLASGAVCTEWHGTFTQVGIEAGTADDVASASFEVRGASAVVPPTAPLAGDGPMVVDVIGAPGFLAGNLLVCDHPGSFGSVSFTGAIHDMFLTQSPADPGVVQIERDA